MFESHAELLPCGNSLSTFILPEGDSALCTLPTMDVHEVRRDQLRELLKTISQSRLAERSGVAQSYISRALKEPGSAGSKNIGEVTARKLEAGARKPVGWLDRRESDSREVDALQELHKAVADLSDDAIGLATWFDRLPDDPKIRRPVLFRAMQLLNYALELAEVGRSISSEKSDSAAPDASPNPSPTPVVKRGKLPA